MEDEVVTEDRGDDHEVPEDEVVKTEVPEPEAPEPEPEETPEPEVKPEPEEHKKDQRIPLARHKEILEKERAARADLEQKLAQYEKGKKVQVFNEDITALENEVLKADKEYTRLLADGELDKAADLMAKMRATSNQIAEAKSDMKIAAAVAQATEQARYNIVVERVEAAYPVLNPDSDEYNERTMARVVKMHNANIKAGMPPASSLQDAVSFVLGEPETKQQERAIETAPRVTQADVAAERKKAAVGKTLDATKRTPPSTSKVGMDSDKMGTLTQKDIMKMSQDEFAKLPENVLARMRGDTL